LTFTELVCICNYVAFSWLVSVADTVHHWRSSSHAGPICAICRFLLASVMIQLQTVV